MQGPDHQYGVPGKSAEKSETHLATHLDILISSI